MAVIVYELVNLGFLIDPQGIGTPAGGRQINVLNIQLVRTRLQHLIVSSSHPSADRNNNQSHSNDHQINDRCDVISEGHNNAPNHSSTDNYQSEHRRNDAGESDNDAPGNNCNRR